jgi:hypothetical protein
MMLSVRFFGETALGSDTVPTDYQVKIEEIGGETVIQEPIGIALERRPEFFEDMRKDASFLGQAHAPKDRAELGSMVVVARGGGQKHELLAPLEFEHLLSLREVTFGHKYYLSIRWLSYWRVSEWSTPVFASMEMEAPVPGSTELRLEPLEPTELPLQHACKEGDENFVAPPAMAHRVELSWEPYIAKMRGGGRMEYHIQQRCMLADGRLSENLSRDRGCAGVDVTPWELAGKVLTTIDDATGQGVGHPAEESITGARGKSFIHLEGIAYSRMGCPLGPRLSFTVEELMPSAEYQFRVFSRLLFHPISGYPGEWSECISSIWHRTPEMVPEPRPPMESLAPDPPPPILLQEGTVLVEFPLLPISERLPHVTGEMPPPPSPYVLQFRGADEAQDAPWHPISSEPLPGYEKEKFLVHSERLMPHYEQGVVFRLWRTALPQKDGDHCAEDDLRIRYFGGLASRPSKPMRVMCPVFSELPPTAIIVFAPHCPYFEKSVLTHEDEGLHEEIEREPLVQLLLRLNWKVHVPAGNLEPVFKHQVCYRRCCEPLLDGEADDLQRSRSNLASQWTDIAPFEEVVTREHAEVDHDLSIAAPRFLLGADYLLRIRIGTASRWGDWSPEIPFSLVLHPPAPPLNADLVVEPVRLKDAAIFFRLKWPAFRPHPLCTLVEYRIRMVRKTHYKYAVRLSDEIKAL